jgi:hypothetical protein
MCGDELSSPLDKETVEWMGTRLLLSLRCEGEEAVGLEGDAELGMR